VDYDDLEEVLKRAPRFGPALALRALIAARFSLLPTGRDADWGERARLAIDAALRDADDLPDTHLAACFVAESRGDFHGAVRALERALTVAPASAEAQELLGRLMMEAGRVAEGSERLLLAADLDWRCRSSLTLIARAALFRGDAALARKTFSRLDALSVRSLEHLVLRLRLLLWRGVTADDDVEAIRRECHSVPFEPGRTLFPIMLEVALGGGASAMSARCEVLGR
jgi:tetratricopeptide (TPR) repeat protein